MRLQTVSPNRAKVLVGKAGIHYDSNAAVNADRHKCEGLQKIGEVELY